MGEMVDRARRAIRLAAETDPALAVIQAMKVPTAEMLEAAGRLPRLSEPSAIWEAMILAAAK
ncbi:hypothetical protein [Bradyrhizobium sp. RT4b]|uniref:hypothetical protein n=1 Tax=Bradyrhizobium sp. RT4b TaxID=3156379 RepID=UPI003394F6D8